MSTGFYIEAQLTREPSKCSIVFHDETMKSTWTIATFKGAGGEDAAKRILKDLQQWAEYTGPHTWVRAFSEMFK